MFKKGVLVSVFIFIFVINFAYAANETGVDKAYQCLENIIEDKTVSSISLEEAIFSTLALGGEKVLKDKIAEQKSSLNCWPKDKCTIKSTALVGLSYKRINKNTADVVDYLYTKNSSATDLIWYLEIDIANHEPSTCTLKYDGLEREVDILEDMKIEGNPGNCFLISDDDYFLTVKESCYQKEIEVTCDKDFITTLLYTKKTGETLYVLPETHSSAALGTTSEKVDVQCFKQDGKCDYEGTLWATLFLHKLNKEIDSFIPYLTALAEENSKYFPESFLYGLTGSNDQYSKIIQKQKQGRTWKMVSTPYNEYYDTSLAMLALAESDTESTRSYLVSIQSASGCWNNNNIRDTAFILYSGWEKDVPGDVDVSGTPLCSIIEGQSCEIYNDCIDAGGRALANFECSGFNICCSIDVPEKSCQEQNGQICSGNKVCSGSSTSSSDEGICCLSECEDPFIQVEETCEVEGYFCSSSCFDNEEEVSEFSCSEGNVCCKPAEKGNSTWIIILLIILIIIIILAIIFRDKLRFYYYKFKGKVSSSPIVRKGVPPTKPAQNISQPQNNNPMVQPPIRRPMPMHRSPQPQRNREFEETLKKLREMSK